jgi:hypothetical protein
MITSRSLLAAAAVASAALAAPAVAGPECGPARVEVESLHLTLSPARASGSGASVTILVSRADGRHGVAGADVTVRLRVDGRRMIGSGRTEGDGRATLSLRLSAARPDGWTTLATAEKVQVDGNGCAPEVVEVGRRRDV